MQLPHHTSLHNFYQDRPPAAVPDKREEKVSREKCSHHRESLSGSRCSPQNYQQHCLGGIMVYEL
uniref:Uncharacterized protein n=1 Tax=Rhizophora mucronata TaxID=61149 RepID=A0A2P2IIR1_RHIMU